MDSQEGNKDNVYSFVDVQELSLLVQSCRDSSCCQDNVKKRFHCPLCPVTKFKSAPKPKVLSHLNTHWKAAVPCPETGRSAVLCHLEHSDNKLVNSRHYHCPMCEKIIGRKQNLMEHVQRTCSNLPQNIQAKKEAEAFDEALDHDYFSDAIKRKHSDDVDDHPPGKYAKRICEICGITFNKKWLKHHTKMHDPEHARCKNDINSKRHHHTVIVDAMQGIFASAINLSGPKLPIHLKRITTGPGATMFCEHYRCIENEKSAIDEGNLQFECPHVQSVRYAVPGEVCELDILTLQAMQSNGLITEEILQQCTYLQDTATANHCPLMVHLPYELTSKKRFMYYSVFSGEKTKWSQLERTIVTFDTVDKSFNCRCSKKQNHCVHRLMVNTHLLQVMPDVLTADQHDEATIDEAVTLKDDVNEVEVVTETKPEISVYANSADHPDMEPDFDGESEDDVPTLLETTPKKSSPSDVLIRLERERLRVERERLEIERRREANDRTMINLLGNLVQNFTPQSVQAGPQSQSDFILLNDV